MNQPPSSSTAGDPNARDTAGPDAAAPSPALDRATIEVAAELSSGRQARRFVEAALVRWNCTALTDVTTLLVSELVANAVMHARSAATVVVLLLPTVVRIEVSDEDPVIPTRWFADAETPSGRGLALVEQLSSSWGITATPTGKCVWFEVDQAVSGRTD